MWCNLCGAIHLTVLKSSSPTLAQTSHPPTRNLFGKTHDAGASRDLFGTTHDASDGGATDDGIDDGALTSDDLLRGSMMKAKLTDAIENGPERPSNT